MSFIWMSVLFQVVKKIHVVVRARFLPLQYALCHRSNLCFNMSSVMVEKSVLLYLSYGASISDEKCRVVRSCHRKM